MKRLSVWLITVLIMLPCISCAALEKGFYCEYTPKSASSSVFYIDISTEESVSAAVFEVSFDSSMVELRAASAVPDTSVVRYRCDKNTVSVAYADSGSVSGKLCRVSFKALRTGSCTFRLHTVQAADGNRSYPDNADDSTLTVKLGKEDVVSERSSSSSKADKTSVGAKGSRRSYTDRGEEEGGAPLSEFGITDLRRSNPLSYILIGAGAVVLIGLLVFLGIMIGRRMNRKTASSDGQNTAASDEQPVEPADIPDNAFEDSSLPKDS